MLLLAKRLDGWLLAPSRSAAVARQVVATRPCTVGFRPGSLRPPCRKRPRGYPVGSCGRHVSVTTHPLPVPLKSSRRHQHRLNAILVLLPASALALVEEMVPVWRQ